MTTPSVSEFARRLQRQGTALALPLTWIEQRLAESGLSIERLVRSGNQSRLPTRFPSATASAVCVCWGRSTAGNSW